MIKYLIIEDERRACRKLKRMISQLRLDYHLEGWTENITKTVDFLKNNRVNLILMDINLCDGRCFEIFDHIKTSTPVIFTTAYNEHTIQAFRHNSVDYLLKPVEEKDLAVALDKYEQTRRQDVMRPLNHRQLEKMIFRNQAKERFLLQKKDSYSYIEARDIAFFYSEDKVVFVHTFANERYIINYTLDLLEQQLAADRFFRVSRNCISNIKAIQTIGKYFNGRLKLTFNPHCPHEILVSRIRAGNFLQWIDGAISYPPDIST